MEWKKVILRSSQKIEKTWEEKGVDQASTTYSKTKYEGVLALDYVFEDDYNVGMFAIVLKLLDGRSSHSTCHA